MGLQCECRLLALPTNIRQGWKWLSVRNAPAYNTIVLINDIVSFMALGKHLQHFILFVTYEWAQ
jgi:hypothetical protein